MNKAGIAVPGLRSQVSGLRAKGYLALTLDNAIGMFGYFSLLIGPLAAAISLA